jgi:hypothetical protein
MNVEGLLAVYWLHVVSCWLFVSFLKEGLLAVCWPFFGSILAACCQNIGCLLANQFSKGLGNIMLKA